MFSAVGNFFSFLSNSIQHIDECNPPVPSEIQRDPAIDESLNVSLARLGYFGYTHDTGVWNGDRPEDSTQQEKRMWMWFSHRTTTFEGSQKGRKIPGTIVSLENFQTTNPDKRGERFYSAVLQQSTSRFPLRYCGQQLEWYKGIALGDEDTVLQSRHIFWEACAYAEFLDGSMRRMEELFGSPGDGTPVIALLRRDEIATIDYAGIANPFLEISIIGKTYHSQVKRIVKETEKDPKNPSVERSIAVEKMENNSNSTVLSKHFRLIYMNHVLAEWESNSDDTDTPLFALQTQSSWFSRTIHRVVTKPDIDIDCTLSLLIAHICHEYFGNSSITSSIPDGQKVPVLESVANPPVHALRPLLRVSDTFVSRQRKRIRQTVSVMGPSASPLGQEKGNNRHEEPFGPVEQIPRCPVEQLPLGPAEHPNGITY